MDAKVSYATSKVDGQLHTVIPHNTRKDQRVETAKREGNPSTGAEDLSKPETHTTLQADPQPPWQHHPRSETQQIQIVILQRQDPSHCTQPTSSLRRLRLGSLTTIRNSGLLVSARSLRF